jgi:hypothetical protein
VNVHLYPHAWLRVKIKNESGAWGFYPDRTQSGTVPIQLLQGKDSTLVDEIKFKKGNSLTKYLFTVREEEGFPPPALNYWSKVKVIKNGEVLPVSVSSGASIEFYLPGHDTTDITIIY